MSRPRILFYNNSARSQVGGVETVYRRLVEAAQKRGYPVMAAYAGSGFERRADGSLTLRLKRLHSWRRLGDPRVALRCASSLWNLAAVLNTLRPDVVNVHFVNSRAVYFALLRRFFGYRLMLSLHGSDIYRPYTPLDRQLLPWLLRHADALTVVSGALAEEVRHLHKGQGPVPVVIPNGIDLAFWKPPAGAQRTGEASVVVSVGRLRAVKGYDVLIDAFARVLQTLSGARLVLVGDGPERPALVRQSQELGIGDRVTFAGEAGPAAVRSRLGEADLFALPSRSEGMSIALLEAMAMGLPAVASAVGGVPDLLKDGSGILVPPEDPAALAEAITRALGSRELRRQMTRQASRIASSYAMSTFVDRYLAVFDAVRPP